MARFWQRTTNSADQLVNRRLLQVGYLAARAYGGLSALTERRLSAVCRAMDMAGRRGSPDPWRWRDLQTIVWDLGYRLPSLPGQPDGADAVPDRAVVAMLDLVGRITEDSHRAVAFDEVQAQWLRGYSQFGVPEPAPFTPDVIAGRSGTSGTSSVVADGPVPSSSDDVELASC